MPKSTVLVLAVVILVAMIKILDWQGADWMIWNRASTELPYFFLSAFAKNQAREVDWSKVYPEIVRSPL